MNIFCYLLSSCSSIFLAHHETFPPVSALLQAKLLEELQAAQNRLDAAQLKVQQEVEETRRKYFKQMEPHFKKRSELFREAGGIWPRALKSNTILQQFMRDEGTVQAMESLVDISFVDIPEQNGFKMVFVCQTFPSF